MEYESGSYTHLDLKSLEKDDLESIEGLEIAFTGATPDVLFAGQ